MRAVLTVLLVIHGAIHVLGFLRWSALAAVPQLGGRTLLALSPTGERAFAGVWLVALLALVAAAAMRLGHHEGWWLPAAGGVLLSQLAIVIAWHDARFGTIANVLILIPVVAAAAHARFARQIDGEIDALHARAQAVAVARAPVEPADLDRLPPPVARWLERAGVVGRPRVATVRLAQRGQLRTSPDGAWLPARAEQHFSVDPPAFVWRVDATMLGLVPVAGRDRYADGRGHMLIKAAALVDVVVAAGPPIDQGSALRFLAEIIWFPSAALAPYLTWAPIDAHRARVTMRDHDLEVSAVFEFDAEGRVTGMLAQRYQGGGADARLRPWRATCTAWGRFDGVEVPVAGAVSWVEDEGDFTYYRWELTALASDEPRR